MSKNNVRVGRHGETIAKQFLEAHGYTIRDQNWRCAHGEVDLIAQRQDVIIFVEVKARTSANFGSPEEAVTPAKQQRLLGLAQHYIAQHTLSDAPWRVDVVAILLTKGGKVSRITHHSNAVQAGW
jgi:putative endonuclease